MPVADAAKCREAERRPALRPLRAAAAVGAFLSIGSASAAAERPILASLLYDSAPPSLSILDLSSGHFVDVGPKGSPKRSRQIARLGGSAEDRAVAQGAVVEGDRAFVWVATGTRLFRFDVGRRATDRDLPLPEGAVKAVVDLVAWREKGGSRVALAVDPEAGRGSPGVLVVDGESGALVGRHPVDDAAMSGVYALRKDGELFALYNQRKAPSDYASITGLRWSPSGGFTETSTMHIPGPGPARGLAALAPIGPGKVAAISASGHFAVLVDLAGPGTLEPFPELEWGESIVAAGGDLTSLPEESEAPVFLVDLASRSILHRSPRDPRGALLRLDLAKAGAPPGRGTALVVSSRLSRGVVSSPSSNRLILFDTARLEPRAVLKTAGSRPTSLLLLPSPDERSR